MASVVLAELSVDSSGVVSGVDEAQQALNSGEKGLDRFGKEGKKAAGVTQGFVGRLFNLRGALNTVARSLGIVSIVAALALGIRRLAADVLAGIPAWSKFKTTLEDVYLSLVKGETLAGRVARKMLAASKTAGIESSFEALERLTELSKVIREGEENLKKIPPGSQLAILTQRNVDTAQRALNDIIDTYEDLGLTVQGLMKLATPTPSTLSFFGTPLAPALAVSGILTQVKQTQIAPRKAVAPLPEELLGLAGLETLPERTRALEDIAAAVRQLNLEFGNLKAIGEGDLGLARFQAGLEKLRGSAKGLKADFFDILSENIPEVTKLATQLERLAIAFRTAEPGTDPLVEYQSEILNIQNALIALGVPLDIIEEKFKSLGFTLVKVTGDLPESGEKVGAFTQAMSDFFHQMTPAQAAADIMGQAFFDLGNALADSLLEGKNGMREAVVDILKNIARMSVVWAVFFLARGIAAAVHPGNIALFGTPSANFAAAAKFAAVAVAAGVASKALGGGSERSRGERDRSDRGGDNRRGGPNVVVQVDGSIFGTDPNELARSIQTLLTKAQADGA